jgi:hypothetical protein
VRLHFAELFYTTGSCIGKRVFGIDILDTATSPDLANIDICKAVGPWAAYDLTVSRVTVSDGSLDIRSVYGAADDPEITSIEVIPGQIAPTVVQTNPTDGAKDIPVATHPTATFSTGMDATTITSSSVTLTRPGNIAVPATVSYDPATMTATINRARPSSSAPSTRGRSRRRSRRPTAPSPPR